MSLKEEREKNSDKTPTSYPDPKWNFFKKNIVRKHSTNGYDQRMIDWLIDLIDFPPFYSITKKYSERTKPEQIYKCTKNYFTQIVLIAPLSEEAHDLVRWIGRRKFKKTTPNQ